MTLNKKKYQKQSIIKKLIILFYICFSICFSDSKKIVNFINKFFINNNIPKVCVFIPIFNKDNYLYRSIKNIQNQTLKNIEIIAVNDFSTDNSLKILKYLSKRDLRIKIVNNDRNHGLLYSRAMGILNCTGEYLINLDPDDTFSNENNLEILYNISKESNLDTIIFFHQKKLDYLNKSENNNEKIFKTRFLNSISNIVPNTSGIDYFITNKFFKKLVILKAFNEFKNRIYGNKWNYHEDNIWSALIYKHSKKIKYLHKYIYIYYFNKESLMHNTGNSLEMKNLIYKFEMIQKIYNYNNITHLFILINKMKNLFTKTIKINKEIKNKFINALTTFMNHQNKSSIIKLIRNIKSIITNNKIIILNKLFTDDFEKSLIHFIIYSFLKENLPEKNIIVINGNDNKELNMIINFIYSDDIFIGFDEIFSCQIIKKLIEAFPNNKKFIFVENLNNSFFNYYSNFSNLTIISYGRNSNNNNIINTKIDFFYIENFLLDWANYYNNKTFFNKTKILFLLDEKKILNNNLFKNIPQYLTNITFINISIFVNNLNEGYIDKLINMMQTYKIIITDNKQIIRLCCFYFVSCILLNNNDSNILNETKLINKLDFIKCIYNNREIGEYFINYIYKSLKYNKELFNKYNELIINMFK